MQLPVGTSTKSSPLAVQTKKLFAIAFGDGKVEGGEHYETTFNALPLCQLGNRILEVKRCGMSCGL